MHTTDDTATSGVTLQRMLSLRTGGALALLLFLLSRPYTGIQHDARLYVGFALAKIDPNGIGRDVLFTADGQSGYSLFPPLFLEVVKWLGPSTAAMVVPLVGLVLWYWVFRRFVEYVFPTTWTDGQKHAAIIVSLALSPYYGGTGVLRFAEPYATPRVFAEALVIGALTLLLAGSRWFAAPMAAAAALHPLMTAPSIGVAIWMKVRDARWRLALLGVAVAALLGLIAASVLFERSTGLLGRFDAQWLAVLEFKRTLVFLRYWNPQDFARTALHFATLGVAWGYLRPNVRQLAGAVMVAVLFGLIATGVGADAAGHILLSQAQLWRGMWLLALVASLCVPVLLYQVWAVAAGSGVGGRSDVDKVATLLLLLAWLVTEVSPNAGPLALVAISLWYAARKWPSLSLPPSGVPVVGAVVGVLVVAVVCTQAWIATGVAWSSPDTSMRWNWNYWTLTGVPGALMLAGAMGPLLENVRSRMVAMTVLSAAALVMVATKFDSRTRYQRYMEQSLDGYVATGTRLVPSDGRPVIWPHADLEAWSFAGSPSWGSITQGIPAVFSRELALTWYSRWTFLEEQGLTPKGEGALAAVGDPAPQLTQTCPGERALLVQTPRQNRTASLLLKVPKLTQPRKVGGRWQQQISLSFRECRTKAP